MDGVLDDFLRLPRRDRYLLTLPPELLTPAELDDSIAAYRRWLAWLDVRLAWLRALLALSRQAGQ